jgi:signal transduction histidine kinase
MSVGGVAVRRRQLVVPARVAAPFGYAVVCAATVTGVALHAANLGSPYAAGLTTWWLMQTVASVAYGTTGAWLARRRPRLAVGWLMLAAAGAQAVSFAGLEYGVWGLGRRPAPVGVTFALWLANWLWMVGLFLVAAVLPLVLPDGRLVSRRWRPALGLAAAATVTNGLQWALAPASMWSPMLARAGVVNPLGTTAMRGRLVGVSTGVLALAAVGVAMASVVVRWRRVDGEVRQQLRWILAGLVVSLLLFFAGFAGGPVLTAAAMLPLPLACLVAVLRYGLWDLPVVISRTVVWVLLTAAVIAVYVGCVWLLGGLLGRTDRARLVATVLVAVGVQPLHQRLRTAVNRMMFGRREDPYMALARLGDQLEAVRDADAVSDQVLPELTRSVAVALHRPYVALVLQDGTTVRHGTPTGTVDQIPLSYGNTPVGRLLISTRAGPASRLQRRALADLGRQAAVAVHTVLLTRQVHASRQHAIAVREEERRRLHRELHDGMGPTLAALALQVETARDLIPAHVEQARRLLDRSLPQLRRAVGDVRDVVHRLRPPALDDLGLEGAIRELAARFATPQLEIDIRVGPVGRLPAAVEVAAYRIVAEAVTNAARHAAARRVQVTLTADGTRLQVTVTDDGRGVRPDVPRGVGLPSMDQRARELGGTFRIGARNARGGTRVEADLPLAALT